MSIQTTNLGRGQIWIEIGDDQIRELISKVEGWREKKFVKLRRHQREIANKVAEQARRNAWGSRRSGDLVESITVVQKLNGTRHDIVAREYYGRFVEIGTVKQAPKPYLKPALASVENEFLEGIKRVIQEAE